MQKKVKYGAMSIVVALSLFLGFVVYAEDNTPTLFNTTSVNDNQEGQTELQNIQNQRQLQNQERQTQLQNLRNENRGELAQKMEGYKLKMKQELELRKKEQIEFKKELEIKKQEAKTKLEESKTTFREKLQTIKDQKKALTAEKILDNLNDLNVKRTSQLTEKLNQMNNVLVSINSRTSKAESKILDLAAFSTKGTAATEALESAKLAITLQAAKSYVFTGTFKDEAGLKAEMKKLRDTFQSDIKALNEKVKLAHTALKDLATSLAKIPKVDEGEEATVEETTTNTNQ